MEERFNDWADNSVQLHLDRTVSLNSKSTYFSRFVLRESNPLRRIWGGIIGILLVYTGTIFLYRISFVTFRVLPREDGEYISGRSEVVDGWRIFDKTTYGIFCVDLIANFFFTYEDANEKEVFCMKQIAKHYLRTDFVINCLGCIPEDLCAILVGVAADGAPVSINQGTRALRLYRVARLTRLIRLIRLGKLALLRNSPQFRELLKRKDIRLANLFVGLAWVVHAMACGWYLVAALHKDPQHTWVARRAVAFEANGDPILLIDASAAEQWSQSIYFILAVFTTVGFGDIYPVTVAEICYVAVVMGVGAIVHSIIISQVIHLVTSIGKTNEFMEKQAELVEIFADHTEVDGEARNDMRVWIRKSAKTWVGHQFDKQAMRDMFFLGAMPRSLLGRLPTALFTGKLVLNDFLKANAGVYATPPRLAVLIALIGHKASFESPCIIYQTGDLAFSMYLVLSGTFAYIAIPSEEGGVPYSPPKQERGRRTSSERTPQAPAVWAAVSKWASAANAGSRRRELGEDEVSKQVSPYQLFSTGAYFGDMEFFTCSQRKTTARCEDSGTLLALHRHDMTQVCEEFPQFRAKWVMLARRRERTRRKRQFELVRAFDRRQLAGRTILLALRRYLERGRNPVARKISLRFLEPLLAAQPLPESDFSEPRSPGRESRGVVQQRCSDGAAAKEAEADLLRRELAVIHRKLDAIISRMSQPAEIQTVDV